MKSCRSPSRTASTFPFSSPVRWSLASLYGCRTYDRISLPHSADLKTPRTSEIWASRCSSRCTRSLDLRTAIAIRLFCNCERSFWQLAEMPVGMCVIRTAVETSARSVLHDLTHERHRCADHLRGCRRPRWFLGFPG